MDLTLYSINPATEQPIAEYEVHSPGQIDARIRLAHEAFPAWRSRPLEQRGQVLLAVADGLRGRKADLAALMTAEMGKTIVSAEAEVEKCAGACEYFANNAGRFLEPQAIPTDATRSYVRFDPLGPILAIMPWNFPFWQLFRFGAPSLMAGNTVVLKHAPNVCGCAGAIESLFREAGAPEGVLVHVRCDNATAQALVAHPLISAVTLTGSERAGRAVAGEAGRALKKCVVELGGSDPFIVLDDADIDAAADAAARSRCINNGQSCIAAKRFIVERSVMGRFQEAMVGRLRQMKVGDPTDRIVELGPLARLDLLQTLHAQVQASLAKGARLLLGGERMPRHGYFYPATVLSDVAPGMPAFDEETFGPLASLTAVDGVEQALEMANRSRYGLAASVWSGNTQRAEHLSGRLESGSVFVNGIVKSDARLPFGGTKNSGFGRELAHFGMHEFCNVKTVWVKQNAPSVR